LLEVSDLTVRYGKRVAVDHLSLSLAAGEVVALLGPNGAGKSTALMAIAGALMPADGSIVVAGSNLKSDPLASRARVGFADQPPIIWPSSASPAVTPTPTGNAACSRAWALRPPPTACAASCRSGCASGSGWPRRWSGMCA